MAITRAQEKQALMVEAMMVEGWPVPKFKIGDKVRHLDRDFDSVVEFVEVDEKWWNDYEVKGWTYSNISCEDSWWGRDDDLISLGIDRRI